MWRTFSRSQVAAFLATLIDYGILITWVELLHQHYSYGVTLGGIFGAISNFFLNRHWSFEAHEEELHEQVFKYALVSGGSLALNTSGVYFLTEFLGIHYLISQVIISLLVGFSYNYPLHHFFVYKKKESQHEGTNHFAATKSEYSAEDYHPGTTQSFTL